MPVTLIDIPYTVIGGLSTANNSGINTLSGYTCPLTRFTFFVPTTPAFAVSAISNDVFLWDLGDGTIQRSATASHIYPFPGMYTVTLYTYNSSGVEFQSTQTRQLSVTNFIHDTLHYASKDVINSLNIPSSVKDNTLPEILLQRQNSWQSFEAVSGTGYTINLYASGSLSKRYDKNILGSTKWGHVDQTWSFYERLTADNSTVEYVPIAKTVTTTEKLYYVNKINDGVPEIIKVSEEDLISEPTAVFVGTSGVSTVFYSDDTPNLNNEPIFLYALTDTSNFPDQQQIINGKLLPPGVLKYHEHSGVVIPAYVKYTPAVNVNFSSNGLSRMPLSLTKWQNTQIPFFVNLSDSNGNFVENYPPLSGKAATKSTQASQTTYVVNLSVTNTSKTQLLSASFNREYDNQLPPTIKSVFRGNLVPHQSLEQAKLIGEVKVDDLPHSPKDNYFYWFVNSDKNKIYKSFDSKTYTTSPTSGSITSTLNLSVTSFNIISNQFTNHYPSFAISPNYDDINKNEITSRVTSTTIDLISSFDSSLISYAPINLRNIFIERSSSRDSIPLIFSRTNNTINAYPTSITLNKDRQLWVGLSGSCIVVGISSDGSLFNVYTPANVTYNSTVTLGNGIIGAVPNAAGIYNLYEPTIVESSADNDIWVAYTNPISSFIEKVDSLSAGRQSIFELPQGYIAKDIVSDNSNNLWVCATDKLRTIQGKSVTLIGGVSGRKSGANLIYKIQTQSISAFEVNQLVSFTGLTNNYYNGTFIIRSLASSAREITVSPYQGRLNQITSNQSLVSNVTATRYLSDRIYKINSSGSKVYELSGFLCPEFIIVDKTQAPWVLHDVNTLTQITSTGTVATNIPIQTPQFINQYVSAGGLLAPTVSSNEIHFGGISCNTFNKVLVLDSYENKLFYIPLTTPTLSGFYSLDSTQSPLWPNTNFLFGSYKAKGDWTGYRWLNKYLNTTGVRTITGETTLNIYPLSGKYKIAKVNESFDPSETIKSYRYQPQLFDHETFFDEFIGTIVGVASSEPTALGKRVYEKISNFLGNHSDIDTCNVNALYSICQELGVDINNYNFNYPGNLQRVIDLLSISRSKLIGGRNKFNRDFDRRGFTNSSYGVNLGSKLDVTTAIVTAGVPIVSRQLFTGIFKYTQTMYVSGLSSEPGYSTKYSLMSSYPLSGYNPTWGWGLEDNVSGPDIRKYYEFYSYTPRFNNIQLEGVIDWNNTYNTVTESMSSVDDWVKDYGIIDTMIDYELRNGLNLFVTPVTSIDTNVL